MRSQQLCMTRHFNGIKPVLNVLPDAIARFGVHSGRKRFQDI